MTSEYKKIYKHIIYTADDRHKCICKLYLVSKYCYFLALALMNAENSGCGSSGRAKNSG